MLQLMGNLWSDELGFIISAELVLVATITVLGMTVGLTEIALALTGELNDVGNAIGSLNQSLTTTGFTSTTVLSNVSKIKAATFGSAFVDHIDECDKNESADFVTGASLAAVEQVQL